jgi:protein TonB
MVRAINTFVALILAVVVTFALFFLMQFLISIDATEPEAGERIKIADITIPEPEIEIQRVEPKPEEVVEPEDLPDLPEENIQIDAPEGPGLNVARVEVDVGGLGDTASISASDGEYLPIVTIPAQYPNRALQRGIEGWCLVSFTVTEQGTVIDPVVVDAEPPNIFDSASTRAVTRFKFNPRMVDGQPVEVHNVQYVFRFNLQE